MKSHHVNLCCSFCGTGQREVKKLIAGPNVYICDVCAQMCHEVIAETELARRAASATPERERARGAAVVLLGSLQANFSAFEGAGVPEYERRSLQAALAAVEAALQNPPSTHSLSPEDEARLCSFCNKSKREVGYLLAKATISICNECVGLCQEVLAEEVERDAAPAGATPPPPSAESPEAPQKPTPGPELSKALESARAIRDMLGTFARLGVPERHRITLGAVGDAIAHYLETGED